MLSTVDSYKLKQSEFEINFKTNFKEIKEVSPLKGQVDARL